MPIRNSQYRNLNMRLVDEEVCKICKMPRIYADMNVCRRGPYERDGIYCPDKRMKEEPKKGSPSSPVRGNHYFVKTGQKVPEPILSGKGEFNNNPLRRLVGYEVEVSDYRDGEACSLYAEKIGAGMYPDCAFEMNTPPMNGDRMIWQLMELSDVLRIAGAVARNGSGLHTHVDCRDLSWNDIRKVCVLYGKTEIGLYSIIDPRRCTSNSSRGGFCKMVGGEDFAKMMDNPSTAKEDIIRFVYGTGENLRKFDRTNKNPPGGDRYLGLNLHSWLMRGTIEFRLHHGTTKYQKMIPWGMLMAGMVQTAADKGDTEINNWPTGKEGILKYAPTNYVRDWVNERWDFFASKRKDKNQPIFSSAVPDSARTRNFEEEDE